MATAEAMARALVTARQQRRGLDGFPGDPPATMAAAYQIQDAAMALWPDTLAGWKIGYIAPDRRSPGEPDRLVGPVWENGCRPAAEHGRAIEVEVFADGFAAVEAELVVRLEPDLPVRPAGDWTSDQVSALPQQLLIGMEIASSPIRDVNALGPTVIASDFGNNAGLVLGPVLDPPGGGAPYELRCLVDDQVVGERSSASLPGGLHHGLATALNVLAVRGHGVRAGMVFATGAVTGIHEVGPDQRCRVEVRGGPAIDVVTRAV